MPDIALATEVVLQVAHLGVEQDVDTLVLSHCWCGSDESGGCSVRLVAVDDVSI